MKKILLTSTGFTNKNIEKKFLEILKKNPNEAKILFIITAAIEPDDIRILPACLDDLTNCGIKDTNIKICDLHKIINQKELNEYDAIYVCGGSTKHLVSRMNELNFNQSLTKYIKQGGIYIGVSAGSVCASKNYPNGLNLIDNILDVHCDKGSNNGIINNTENIYLTDNQALLITDKEIIVFE